MAVKKAESAEEKKSLASAMPDPMIGFMIQNVGALGTSTVGKEEMSMQGVVFTQEIPFPGKLSTKGRAAAKNGGTGAGKCPGDQTQGPEQSEDRLL